MKKILIVFFVILLVFLSNAIYIIGYNFDKRDYMLIGDSKGYVANRLEVLNYFLESKFYALLNPLLFLNFKGNVERYVKENYSVGEIFLNCEETDNVIYEKALSLVEQGKILFVDNNGDLKKLGCRAMVNGFHITSGSEDGGQYITRLKFTDANNSSNETITLRNGKLISNIFYN